MSAILVRNTSRGVLETSYLAQCAWYVMTSDASKEGADIPGMGGYFCSLWWTIPLQGWLWEVTIPALELVTFAVNLIPFESVVDQLLRNEYAEVIAFIDAQASPQLLIKEGTTSRTMSRVLSVVQKLTQYQKFKSRLSVAHTYGEGNGASDCSSRGKFKQLGLYCAQIGVRARQLSIKSQVEDFLEDVRLEWDSLF